MAGDCRPNPDDDVAQLRIGHFSESIAVCITTITSPARQPIIVYRFSERDA